MSPAINRWAIVDCAYGTQTMGLAPLVAQHRRHQIAAFIAMRGIRKSLVARQACRDDIVAKNIRGLDRMSHRLDALGIDFSQLIDVAHDLSQLDRHSRKLIISELQPGEQGHLLNVLARNTHREVITSWP